jgi:hypothetical protein
VSTTQDARTIVHELGHIIEHQVPGAKEAALEFLDYRCRGKPVVSLAEQFPGSGYTSDEMARDGGFAPALASKRFGLYAGKLYGARATELISMGLEQLYADPSRFAAVDPEYCSFITGILDGSIRK